MILDPNYLVAARLVFVLYLSQKGIKRWKKNSKN